MSQETSINNLLTTLDLDKWKTKIYGSLDNASKTHDNLTRATKFRWPFHLGDSAQQIDVLHCLTFQSVSDAAKSKNHGPGQQSNPRLGEKASMHAASYTRRQSRCPWWLFIFSALEPRKTVGRTEPGPKSSITSTTHSQLLQISYLAQIIAWSVQQGKHTVWGTWVQSTQIIIPALSELMQVVHRGAPRFRPHQPGNLVIIVRPLETMKSVISCQYNSSRSSTLYERQPWATGLGRHRWAQLSEEEGGTGWTSPRIFSLAPWQAQTSWCSSPWCFGSSLCAGRTETCWSCSHQVCPSGLPCGQGASVLVCCPSTWK